MKTKFLNYTIVIEPDEETGTGKPVFTAHCPSLGIADDGKTIDLALKHIQKAIEFHLESLSQEGEPAPTESSTASMLTMVKVKAPSAPLTV